MSELVKILRFAVIATLSVLCLTIVCQTQLLAENLSCSPPGADLSDLSPAHFSDAQRGEMVRSYAAPEVRGLRASIDSYLAGDAGEKARQLLKGTSRTMLRKRFVLFNDAGGQFGGSFLIVQFKGFPDSIYEAWVYPLGSGPYDLRAWVSAKCSSTQQRWLKARYGSLSAMVGG